MRGGGEGGSRCSKKETEAALTDGERKFLIVKVKAVRVTLF